MDKEKIKGTAEKINEIGDFIHNAFCVDGTTTYDGFVTIIKGSCKNNVVQYKIEDKSRGEFFVIMYKG